MSTAVVEAVTKAVQAPIEELGLELYDVEFLTQDGRRVLRLTLDAPGGVGLEDCQKASRAVSERLEELPELSGRYSLEVSSPGLDRKLKTPEHFACCIGRRIKVQRRTMVENRRNYKGALLASDDKTITVSVEGAGEFTIPLDEIVAARLEIEI